MSALLFLIPAVLLGAGAFWCLWVATRPEDDAAQYAADWDATVSGPGPFVLADGPPLDDSWIEEAVLNHPAVDASYEDHVATALAIIEWPTHPAHRAEFSDSHLASLLEQWGGEVR